MEDGMTKPSDEMGAPERKFLAPETGLTLSENAVIEGYASLFGARDQGGDVVRPGAYKASLAALKAAGRRVKMLWQHDPGEPIGIWDELREDARGLWVKGRLLTEVARGREAAALLAAGAIDGLSIGYRTVKAERDGQGRRLLQEIELWEVSLVTFPMLPEARVAAKAEALVPALRWTEMAQEIRELRRSLALR
jgi:HK97 family phage prohead protease